MPNARPDRIFVAAPVCDALAVSFTGAKWVDVKYSVSRRARSPAPRRSTIARNGLHNRSRRHWRIYTARSPAKPSDRDSRRKVEAAVHRAHGVALGFGGAHEHRCRPPTPSRRCRAPAAERSGSTDSKLPPVAASAVPSTMPRIIAATIVTSKLLEHVGGHAGAVADVVAHQVGDHRGVAGSSSGSPASTLPTRSAPTSAALV